MTQSEVGSRLNQLLVEADLQPLEADEAEQFNAYLSLILRWNTRMNLTATRDQDGILSRHFVESIACARALPAQIRTLLDFGSGAGLPGIPIAICRPEITVTLAESKVKKAAFLNEAVRVLELTARVHSGRAEDLASGFDCVVLRAVDKMAEAVTLASSLVGRSGWLAVMTTSADLSRLQQAAPASFSWKDVTPLPGGDHRIVAIAQR